MLKKRERAKQRAENKQKREKQTQDSTAGILRASLLPTLSLSFCQDSGGRADARRHKCILLLHPSIKLPRIFLATQILPPPRPGPKYFLRSFLQRFSRQETMPVQTLRRG